MKPKNLISTITVVLIVAALFIWGKSNQKSSTASVQGAEQSGIKSELAAVDTFYDFGTISMKDGKVKKDFTFTNSTGKDIDIHSIATSCMCTAAFLVNPDGKTAGPFGMPGMGGTTMIHEIIKAGESRTLQVVYDPNAHGPAGVGAIDRFVTVADSSGGTIQFEIKALVTP